MHSSPSLALEIPWKSRPSFQGVTQEVAEPDRLFRFPSWTADFPPEPSRLQPESPQRRSRSRSRRRLQRPDACPTRGHALPCRRVSKDAPNTWLSAVRRCALLESIMWTAEDQIETLVLFPRSGQELICVDFLDGLGSPFARDRWWPFYQQHFCVEDSEFGLGSPMEGRRESGS